jgi:hypothetical protein
VKRARAIISASVVCFVIAGFAVYNSAQNRHRTCEYEQQVWADLGLPNVGSSERDFNRIMSDEKSARHSNVWARELVCSGQQAEAGRVLRFYLEGPKRNASFLALVSSELSFLESKNGSNRRANDFRALFSHPSFLGAFESTLIDRQVASLREGDISFRQALYNLMGSKLKNDAERLILSQG